MNLGKDTDIVIRAARLADIPELLRMMEELAGHHGDICEVNAATLEQDVFGTDPWVEVMIAEQPGFIFGYAVFYRLYRQKDGRKGVLLEHLFVKSNARGRGIGRRLVEAVLSKARQIGCTFCMVETHPDNHIAQNVYTALGFKVAGNGAPKFKLSMVP